MMQQRYMIVLIGGTLASAFFIERLAAGAAAGRLFIPPLSLLAVLAWFPALPLSWRIWLGGGAGFLADSFGDFRFGAAILLMIFLALLTGFFRSIISDRRPLFAKGAIAACLMGSFFLLVPLAAKIAVSISV